MYIGFSLLYKWIWPIKKILRFELPKHLEFDTPSEPRIMARIVMWLTNEDTEGGGKNTYDIVSCSRPLVHVLVIEGKECLLEIKH